jgi:hypothetical protein
LKQLRGEFHGWKGDSFAAYCGVQSQAPRSFRRKSWPVGVILALTTDLSLGVIIAFTSVLTILNYLVVDFLIFPPWGNTAATLAEGGVAFVTVFSLRTYGYVDSLHALFVAVTVMLVEGLYFHGFFLTRVLQQR